MTEVADLLAQSMQFHLQAKGKPKRPPDARRKWSYAHFLRYKAHGLDPHHEDPAWEQEQIRTPNGRDTHTDLMAFYKAIGAERIEPPEPEPVVEQPQPAPPQPEPETPRAPIQGTYETFATSEPREPEQAPLKPEDHEGFEIKGRLTPIKRKPRAKAKAKK